MVAIAALVGLAIVVRNGGTGRPHSKPEGATSTAALTTPPTAPATRSARDWLKLGVESLQRREAALAVDQVSEALKDDPENITALIERGKALTHLEDWFRAGVDFIKAIQLDPRNSQAYGWRAFVRLGESDFLGVIAATATRR